MPGTPMAKSASLCSENSFTWRGVITCSASDLRSSGRIGAYSSGRRSPCTRSVGGRPTLRCRSEAPCWIIRCRIPLKLNTGAALGAGAAPPCATAGPGATAARAVTGVRRDSAIRVDAEQDLAVLHGVRVLHDDLAHHAAELRLDLIHDLHRLDDAENLPFGDARPLGYVGIRARLRRGVKRSHHRRLHLEQLGL